MICNRGVPDNRKEAKPNRLGPSKSDKTRVDVDRHQASKDLKAAWTLGSQALAPIHVEWPLRYHIVT
jgi:hypothetical protein